MKISLACVAKTSFEYWSWPSAAQSGLPGSRPSRDSTNAWMQAAVHGNDLKKGKAQSGISWPCSIDHSMLETLARKCKPNVHEWGWQCRMSWMLMMIILMTMILKRGHRSVHIQEKKAVHEVPFRVSAIRSSQASASNNVQYWGKERNSEVATFGTGISTMDPAGGFNVPAPQRRMTGLHALAQAFAGESSISNDVRNPSKSGLSKT